MILSIFLGALFSLVVGVYYALTNEKSVYGASLPPLRFPRALTWILFPVIVLALVGGAAQAVAAKGDRKSAWLLDWASRAFVAWLGGWGAWIVISEVGARVLGWKRVTPADLAAVVENVEKKG